MIRITAFHFSPFMTCAECPPFVGLRFAYSPATSERIKAELRPLHAQAKGYHPHAKTAGGYPPGLNAWFIESFAWGAVEGALQAAGVPIVWGPVPDGVPNYAPSRQLAAVAQRAALPDIITTAAAEPMAAPTTRERLQRVFGEMRTVMANTDMPAPIHNRFHDWLGTIGDVLLEMQERSP